MMKKMNLLLLVIAAVFLMTGCGKQENIIKDIDCEDVTDITLSDSEIKVNGVAASSNHESDVYTADDIVFYLAGQDFTYGEGTKQDEHTQSEADKHTVIHITKPGTYSVSGSLSAGQIAVDLGEDAKENPEAVVNLILNGANITCSVAPAVIFYNVYECGNSDSENATPDTDLTHAGANVIIADDTTNRISGSYVARIYESYELNDDGTEVIDSKKLHKYDGAFYSKMSMNIYGGETGNGVLNIDAENEGLDTELHLSINGGNINITSGNDGINTNEDNISVTTINGGNLNILVTGETGEGDGIDSNGWLVINGGSVNAQACSTSGDAGIDSDMGIHINGGTVSASGNMLDRISESSQTYAVFQFAAPQKGGSVYTLKNDAGDAIMEYAPQNDFSFLILSSPELAEGNYSIYLEEIPLSVSTEQLNGRHGPMPEKAERPKDMKRPSGEIPERQPPKMPEKMPDISGSVSTKFNIVTGGNYFNIRD